MARYCPNCSSELGPAEFECSKCGALFSPYSSLVPTDAPRVRGLVSTLDMPISYRVSGALCGTIFGTFLGFIFSGINQPLITGYSPMKSNWQFWAICSTVILVGYTFTPKPQPL